MTVGSITRCSTLVSPTLTGADAFALFDADATVSGLCMQVEPGAPLRLLMRSSFLSLMGSRFGWALYERRGAEPFFEPNPLVLDADTPILTAAEIVFSGCGDIPEGLVVTRNGGFEGVLRGVDLVRAVAHRAQKADATKTRFLANVSHELRTPLNAIIGYAELLLDEEVLSATGRGDLTRIHAASTHLRRLIDDLLSVGKLGAEREEVVLRACSVRDLVLEALDSVRPQAKAGAVTLAVTGLDDIGDAITDPFRVKQCLLNLLSNACKFAVGGTVTLAGSREGGALVFAVRDTGPGMSTETVERLFQPFMQADATISQKFGGTGLGLAITQGLARLLGGDVRVESALGEGSTFTLTVADHARFEAAA